MNQKNKIEERAKTLWGEDLHKDKIISPHCSQLEEIFPEEWIESLNGSLLEIGCGSGADLSVFASNSCLDNITAIDLGANIKFLSTKYKDRIDIRVQQGNALSLDFTDDTFNIVYSFGIFHHTSDPIQCIREAQRVLQCGGKLFLYLYSSHEDILFKRYGILIEKLIMKFFQYLPYKIQNLFCIFLSPLCWILFSLPSRIIGFCGYKRFSKKIPFYFGIHPLSLIGDLKDRLMSPINHRFTKLEMETILLSLDFLSYQVVKTSSGLYIYAIK
jgi:SAM-dependent methyltransferase